jgi:hypothetical protein
VVVLQTLGITRVAANKIAHRPLPVVEVQPKAD